MASLEKTFVVFSSRANSGKFAAIGLAYASIGFGTPDIEFEHLA